MTPTHFEEFEQDPIDINPKYLFYSILIHPKSTLQYILKYCPSKFVFPLLIIGGIAQAFQNAIEKGMGDNQSTGSVLVTCILGGAIFGWIGYYIYAWMLQVTGKWLGSKAEFEDYKTILAWAQIPSLVYLLLLGPQLFIFGDDLFRSDYVFDAEIMDILVLIIALIEVGLGIWSLVISVIGIKEISGFGIGKAILNLIMPFLVVVAIVAGMVFLFTRF